MQIEEITLKNFRCFNEISINTSDITLLTGANSSGKSSLMYGVLGAIQSREFPFQFSPNGKYIKMGDYAEIVHNHDNNLDIEIGFKFKKGEKIETINTIWRADKTNNLPVLKSLSASSDYYSLEIIKIKKYDLKFKYFPENDPNYNYRNPDFLNKIFKSFDKVFSEIEKDDKKGKDEKSADEILKRYSNQKNEIEFKFTNISELEGVVKSKGNFYLDTTLSTISKVFTTFDDGTNYISSFRLYPERTYYETSKLNLKVGKFGENYEDQIIAWEGKNDPKYKELLSTMKEIGLFYEIKTKRLDGGRFEILIRNKKDGIWSALSDVGFGISQFLPIIVADLQLGKKSTLFIAQPEIHLHPKIQAQFADYIISQIKNSEKRYVIETHSEYLINRLRLAVTEEKISENQVNTYYIENNGQKTKKYELNFLKNGQIKGAPKGFFDTYMLDVMNIAISAN
ncbi:DUF3696 domain-containing protein [Tenacibaculum sp. ZH5_bin.1]|uniref:DUF3696 domain-containing protein n=1 Tax=Tenacibaculum TaxID=104267 RepID=UPI001430BA82|nr:DUF3696 domain-containing protein [Tenacibaculum mesophilum]KAF9658280.1 DUF3696 domain-containing protein [Tenacibaculum mesophilum]